MLSLSFFLIALIYAMAGFGGGSSYIAVLTLIGFSYALIPPLALICNLLVVSSSSFNFIRYKHLEWPLFWPFFAGSVPMAFIGGSIPISKDVFLLLLGVCLLFAGAQLMFSLRQVDLPLAKLPPWYVNVLLGALLGLLAGLSGIGGGIFLSPLLLGLRWGQPKPVATAASLFILANSLAGLAGQWLKHGDLSPVLAWWPLFLAVVAGGQLGSLIGAGKLPQGWVRGVTAALVLVASGRLLWPYLQLLVR